MNKVLAYGAALLLIVGCSKKEEVVEPIVEKPVVPTEFVPNVDGKISAHQASGWKKANGPLNELVIEYTDSLKVEDTTQYAAIYSNYTEKRDAICKDAGLVGEHKEYLWVTENLSNAINAPLLDSLKMK